MTIRAIFSMDAKKGMGNKGELLFNISDDLKRFKKLTEGDTVLMGKKTWNSLPIKPLPNRDNVVVTSSIEGIDGRAKVVDDPHLVLDYHRFARNEDLWIIGGANLIEQAILEDYVDEVYMTIILDESKEADVFFNQDVFETVKYEIMFHENKEFVEDGETIPYANLIKRKKKKKKSLLSIKRVGFLQFKMSILTL